MTEFQSGQGVRRLMNDGPELHHRPDRRDNFPAPRRETFVESKALHLRHERENWLQLGDVVSESLGRLFGDVEYRPARPQDLDAHPPAPKVHTPEARVAPPVEGPSVYQSRGRIVPGIRTETTGSASIPAAHPRRIIVDRDRRSPNNG